MSELANITTASYNDDETVLTIAVNDKVLNKYAFIKTKPRQDPCDLCDFIGTNCEPIKCLWDQRKDISDGYYKVIEDIEYFEANRKLMNTCKELANDMILNRQTQKN